MVRFQSTRLGFPAKGCKTAVERAIAEAVAAVITPTPKKIEKRHSCVKLTENAAA